MGNRASLCCVALATALAAGCAGELDTRVTPPRGSLGRELYTLLCDRVAAQALREDVTGASFHDVCHANERGEFVANTVDTTKLPALDENARDVDGRPVSLEKQRKNREHRIARVEALARRRDDLVVTFDEAFANEPLRATCAPDGAPSDLRTELAAMLGRLSDLYDDDTIPHLTRSMSRIMTAIEGSSDAQVALTKLDARRGYRPADVALGPIRPLLSYPAIAEVANSVFRVLSVGNHTPGSGHDALVKLLASLHEELRTAEVPAPLPALVLEQDAARGVARLSRPRSSLEIARTILLARDPAFADGAPRWLVARDSRGVAQVALASGSIPPPFVDLTGPEGQPDGLADVDDVGQFSTATGALPPPPFPYPGMDPAAEANASRDPAGRSPLYDYIDASSTYLAALTRDLVPLVDPEPAHAHETLMDLAAGLVPLARGPDAPLLDLAHAVAQLLADDTIDDTLALLQHLAEHEPALLARIVGAGLQVKAIADAHPEAHLGGSSTLWDEMLDVAVTMAEKPSLFADLVRAFGDDATLDLPRSAIGYMTMRDELSYDPDHLNGPPLDRTTGKVEELTTPVDRSQPDIGENQSAFQRFLSALHDTKGMSVCTKPGAVAHIVWNGLPLDFPSFSAQAACFAVGAAPPPDPMPMCGMLRIKNISQDLIDAVLGSVKLDIRDDCLRKLAESPLTGVVGGADAFLEQVSGIQGFNTKPTVPAINRLVYFDLPYSGHVGDTKNAKTRTFLEDLFDPAPTRSCPPVPFTDKDGAQLDLRHCATFDDSLRARDPGALFPLEQFGFLASAKPLARAFQKSDANLLFVELLDVLQRHWALADEPHDGGVTYEPLVAEALAGDLFPALHDAVKKLEQIHIAHCDARDASGACTSTTPRDGVEVLSEAMKQLVDPARNVGLRRRNGETTAVRNDGTTNPQVTPIYLLVDALKAFDARLAERRGAWQRGRSQLVDQLFTVDGTGDASRLRNQAVTAILPRAIATVREQIAAHCPDPVKGCAWAREELPNRVREIVTGATFGSALEVVDAVRADEPARTELERLLQFLLASDGAHARDATLTALVDALHVLDDDANVTPLLRAFADAFAPEVRDDEGSVVSRGFVLAAIEVASRILGEVHDESGSMRLCAREIDPNRTLPVVLRRLVTPPDAGARPPVDVLLDVVADVNRANPRETTKLRAEDYASIAHEVSEFCSDPARGLEQVYEVIKQATKEP